MGKKGSGKRDMQSEENVSVCILGNETGVGKRKCEEIVKQRKGEGEGNQYGVSL